jgi:hypothetical protein
MSPRISSLRFLHMGFFICEDTAVYIDKDGVSSSQLRVVLLACLVVCHGNSEEWVVD